MRAGVWFRRLPQIDRVLVDLTIKLTETVRSIMLAKSLLSIVKKLEGLLESRFTRKVRMIGFSLAYKCSMLGVSWGNKSCKNWAEDSDYARFLAIMTINGGQP